MLNRYLDTPVRKVIALVAFLNLAYFGVEFAVALKIGSVSLFADSVDFLEDASVNLLILLALAWSARGRARVGMLQLGVIFARDGASKGQPRIAEHRHATILSIFQALSPLPRLMGLLFALAAEAGVLVRGIGNRGDQRRLCEACGSGAEGLRVSHLVR
ncbi:cation transporter [Rhizobium leguminosarum]|uniref:cation transporter n=1 Tax=Rhizobium leguminosarum TaxID=384 RepID=UPI003F948B08